MQSGPGAFLHLTASLWASLMGSLLKDILLLSTFFVELRAGSFFLRDTAPEKPRSRTKLGHLSAILLVMATDYSTASLSLHLCLEWLPLDRQQVSSTGRRDREAEPRGT